MSVVCAEFAELKSLLEKKNQEQVTSNGSTTTSNRSLGQLVESKVLENSPQDSLSTPTDGKSSVNPATTLNPKSKMVIDTVLKENKELLKTLEAYKEKQSKIRPSLLPVEVVIEGTKAMEFGALKYGADQWKEVDMDARQFMDALERHLIALKQGEMHAQDSGVHHLGHIIANCGILLNKFGGKF